MESVTGSCSLYDPEPVKMGYVLRKFSLETNPRGPPQPTLKHSRPSVSLREELVRRK